MKIGNVVSQRVYLIAKRRLSPRERKSSCRRSKVQSYSNNGKWCTFSCRSDTSLTLLYMRGIGTVFLFKK